MSARRRLLWALAAAAVFPVAPRAAVGATVEPLRVGSRRTLQRPSAAAQVARDGDVIEIDTEFYDGDAAVWTQNGLTIRGVGGRAHLRASGAHAEGKAIWVVKGSNTTVEGIEFSGASVPHRNGAGIRLEGPGLTVRDCYFHHNENGILTGAHPESDILIEHSEFSHNGFGDGYSHNLYIGAVRSFTLRFSYAHHAVVGHNVKSRALMSHIAYDRITDEHDGRASYAIDLPNGGLAYVVGNILQKGPAAENDAIVAYGAEGLRHPLNELYFVHNTAVNDLPVGGRFLFIHGHPAVARIVNNVFSGPGEMPRGPGELAGNVRAPASDFTAPADFHYALNHGATAIGRGIDPGTARGLSLRPVFEYVHKLGKRQRGATGPLDSGALAYGTGR